MFTITMLLIFCCQFWCTTATVHHQYKQDYDDLHKWIESMDISSRKSELSVIENINKLKTSKINVRDIINNELPFQQPYPISKGQPITTTTPDNDILCKVIKKRAADLLDFLMGFSPNVNLLDTAEQVSPLQKAIELNFMKGVETLLFKGVGLLITHETLSAMRLAPPQTQIQIGSMLCAWLGAHTEPNAQRQNFMVAIGSLPKYNPHILCPAYHQYPRASPVTLLTKTNKDRVEEQRVEGIPVRQQRVEGQRKQHVERPEGQRRGGEGGYESKSAKEQTGFAKYKLEIVAGTIGFLLVIGGVVAYFVTTKK